MTDSSSLITTHPISNSYPVTAPPVHRSPLPNGTLSDNNAPEEEEYTIKCICGYADDDGSTVYCPKCDTWQHIECYYYPTKKVPEDHYCADCLPRELDAKRAAERQRKNREALDGGDRKLKRPSSKGQKKKHKDSITIAEQINGWHPLERHDSLPNGRDQPPPAKKPKTNHRTSGSVASLNGEARKRASSNVQSYPSPSKSPQDFHRYPPIAIYTAEFLELYDRDDGTTTAIENEHTIQATNKLSALRSNPSVIANVGEQPSVHKPFVRAAKPVDPSTFPQVSVELTKRKELEIEGKIPTWRYIKTQVPIEKDALVGEIKGEVGTLQEYCHQQSTPNRWQELGHPDPFVFFHPHMDIYIDSRKAGTQFRYLRRSCTPNVTLKTFVFEDREWRHCFVAREDIPAGKELTAAWFLDPQVMLSSDPNSEQDDPPFSRQCDWVSRVLANFGDCACNKGGACGFHRFDRRSHPKSLDSAEKRTSKKRKQKAKSAISPLSTGQATNSRAGSETLKQEDEDPFDRNSSSGSAGSDAKSRDMTPVAALDANPVLGSDLTERELRKIKAAERIFEQGNKSSQKKKKRTSGGSNLNTPNNTKLLSQSPHALTPTGNDVFSGSPPPRSGLLQRVGNTTTRTQASPPTPARPVYQSVGIQTDPEEPEMPLPKRRKKFVTHTQVLLRRVMADKVKFEQQCKSDPNNLYRPSLSPTASAPAMSREVEMKDMATGLSPVSVKSAPLPSPSTSSDTNPSPTTSPVYPLPSQAAHSQKPFKVPPAAKLQLSTLPPVPTFTTTGTGNTPSTSNSTPLGSISATVQSPVAIPTLTPGIAQAVTPSPAKKKLSLGDYMSLRRNTNSATTPSMEKSQSQANATAEASTRKDSDGSIVQNAGNETIPRPKPDDSVREEAAAQGGLSGSAIEDAPMKDDGEVDEHEYAPPEPEPVTEMAEVPTTETGADPGGGSNTDLAPSLPVQTTTESTATSKMSPEVSSVLAQIAQLHEKQPSQSAGSTG